MATYVLVHGLWHGGWCWKKVRSHLQEAGHEVFTPTLTGCGERSHLRSFEIDMNTHVRDIVQVLEFEELHQVILCGHSYSVLVILAVAEAVPERLAHLVALDGPVPANGQSCKDIFSETVAQLEDLAKIQGDDHWVSAPPEWTFGITEKAELGWVKSKLTAIPLKVFETPIIYSNPLAAALPRTYLQCMENPSNEEVNAANDHWTSKGWRFRLLRTGHDAMVTQPLELAKLLLGLAV